MLSIKWAWGIWGIFALIVFVLVWMQPHKRTVTHHYRIAAENWLAQKNLYTAGTEGFLYLPQSAILYTPFTLFPNPARQILWRTFILILYASAIWRLSKILSKDKSSKLFLVTTLLAIPAALSSARNGQMNMPLAALMIHAAIEMMEKRWWRSTFLLIIALAMKPLAIVFILLAGALYAAMRWQLLTGLAVLILFPFLVCWDWVYVKDQYILAFDKIFRASAPERYEWCNLECMLRFFHVYISRDVMMILRLLAAAATLMLGWFIAKKHDGSKSVFATLTLATGYLMLFNPRTETNSYVMLSPIIGVLAAQAFFEEKNKLVGWFLTILAVGLGCDSYGDYVHPYTNLWFKPAICILFLLYFFWIFFKRPSFLK